MTKLKGKMKSTKFLKPKEKVTGNIGFGLSNKTAFENINQRNNQGA
eukprot:CAMPEP_0170523596 /NCGR_PEP_ID=MMETSP0209-20121228/9006_1 /TAXON_ID=665100 ORGANISM="Litonotus pictus, Strain P1" /NCGR_SAMPLE_ID=MMETSP0209 /ASSEMBLY_ACC=CAM_ASM_000301 /LENGTH=45 /DNA_ID= /DNA_START= /DNA_END= /DNA_ORIENTATION=